MKQFNLGSGDNPAKENKKNTYEDGLASVSRIPEEETEDTKKHGDSMLQKLTIIGFVAICAVFCVFVLRIQHHFKQMNSYQVPEDAVYQEGTGMEQQDGAADENVEEIKQVTYNPSEAAKKNYAERKTYGGPWSRYPFPVTWKFCSGYNFTSAKIDCIWLCTYKNKDGKEIVLKIRTATYDGASDTFDDKNSTVYNTSVPLRGLVDPENIKKYENDTIYLDQNAPIPEGDPDELVIASEQK